MCCKIVALGNIVVGSFGMADSLDFEILKKKIEYPHLNRFVLIFLWLKPVCLALPRESIECNRKN